MKKRREKQPQNEKGAENFGKKPPQVKSFFYQVVIEKHYLFAF